MKNGKNFDTFRTENLIKVLDETQKQEEKTDLVNLIKKMYSVWKSDFERNSFFKRTPKVFGSNAVFLVNLYQAFNTSLGNCLNVNLFFNYIYTDFVLTYISSMPDVDVTEAKRILKEI